MQEDILAFWFGDRPGVDRAEWFRADAEFDDEIRRRFGPVIDAAIAGAHADWNETPRGSLARVIVLDQFTRNVFRGTPRAFAGDDLALATARQAIARGFDAALTPVERRFLYMPFQHSERLEVQRESLQLFARLAAEGLTDPLRWAQHHHDIIARFGRFPHRNDTLGRVSTPDEQSFLGTPGSRF